MQGFVKNIVIIIIILIMVFLSQHPYFNKIGRKFYFQAESQVKIYWTKTADWFKNSIYSMVSGEVEQKSSVIQQEINKQKNNIVQNIWMRTKNYFAAEFSKIFGTEVK